jgi:hypothetical protein
MTPPDPAAEILLRKLEAMLEARQQEAVAAWDALATDQLDQLEVDPVPSYTTEAGTIANLARWGVGLKLEIVPVRTPYPLACSACGAEIGAGAPALAFAYTSPRARVWVYRYECPAHFGSWLAEKEGVRLKRRPPERSLDGPQDEGGPPAHQGPMDEGGPL